ncbi:MAG: UbiA family prenyltransferase [Bdellovibrionaceae bacterium]|nr:UbiA family prenyltransferase [Pseudobdellovibrionaceae bacterium]
MIFFFSLGLGMYLSTETGNGFKLEKAFVAFVLLLSFFFRLRLFDEIKDYAVDLKYNPTRPLARGVLSVDQVKLILLVLIFAELIVTALLGKEYFFIHLVAIFYSLLMFEEFFLGSFLRPRLVMYAVTHTFVSSLSGFSAALVFSGASLDVLSQKTILFFVTPWFYFNLFEFARKTYAREEERSEVETYSLLFGPGGAWALSMSQVLLGLGFLHFLNVNKLEYFYVLASVYFLLSLAYLFNKSTRSAKFFRNISGVFLLAHFLLLTFVYWR